MTGQRVGHHDDLVLELGGVSSRRLATDIRHGAGDQNRVDAARIELLLQIAFAGEEGAGAGLDGVHIHRLLLKRAKEPGAWSAGMALQPGVRPRRPQRSE
jgi:hypothetical protein